MSTRQTIQLPASRYFDYADRSAWKRADSRHITKCETCRTKIKGGYIQGDATSVHETSLPLEPPEQCFPCALKFIYRESIQPKNREAFSDSTIKELFAPETPLELRLALLIDPYHEFNKYLENSPPTIFNPIIRQLAAAFVVEPEHPLAEYLRLHSLLLLLRFTPMDSQPHTDLISKLYPAPETGGLSDLSGDLAAWNRRAGTLLGVEGSDYDPAFSLIYLALAGVVVNPFEAAVQRTLQLALYAADQNNPPAAAYLRDFFTASCGPYLPRLGLITILNDLGERIVKFGEQGVSEFSSGELPNSSLQPVLNSHYKQNELKTIYNCYLKKILFKNSKKPSTTLAKRHTLSKNQYIKFFLKVLDDPELCRQFVAMMNEPVLDLLKQTVWLSRKVLLNRLVSDWSLDITLFKSYNWYNAYQDVLPKEFSFFLKTFDDQNHYYYNRPLKIYCYLHPGMVERFRKVLPRPEAYELTPIADPDEYLASRNLTITANTAAADQLVYLSAYFRDVGLQYSKNGNKVLKSSLKQVKNLCKIPEPYENQTSLAYLRTEMLIKMTA
ncbi:MAG: hypothetical protein PF495_17170, partial [Spirochaetales bacterium]|nr:hypothetical protein [Spirochaetales bacterium]